MKKLIRLAIALAALGVVLYLTNPSMTDFGAYYEKQQVSKSQQGTTGILKDLAKAIAQTGADLVVKVGYRREDKVLFSYFTLGPASKPTERYLGLAKVVFIKVK